MRRTSKGRRPNTQQGSKDAPAAERLRHRAANDSARESLVPFLRRGLRAISLDADDDPGRDVEL